MNDIVPRVSDLDHLKWLKRRQLDNFAGKALLDLGCGSGFLCETAARGGARRVVGVDIIPPNQTPSSTWSFKNFDLNNPTWGREALATLESGEGFSHILAFDIIEHLDAPALFLQNCRQIMRPTGALVLTTPNCSSWERLCHPRDWSGARDQQHKVLFSPYSLQFLLERSGFVIEYLQAPMRILGPGGHWLGKIGGQIIALARPVQPG